MALYPNENNETPNPNYILPASVKRNALIRISESEDFFVDYDKDRGMYRVSVINNDHSTNGYWFDCYEEKECIVRCKDCRHYNSYGYLYNPKDLLYRCRFGIFNNQRDNKDSEFFCCYGEPRVKTTF